METTDHNNPEERLIQDGMPSYLEAMMALRELQRIMREKCRKVLANHLANFAGAIGQQLSEDKIQDVTNPDCVNPRDWDGTWAILGVSIWLQDFGKASFTLDVWHNGQRPQICATARVTPYGRNRFNKTWQILSMKWQKPNATGQVLEKVDRDGDILLYKEVPLASMLNFEAVLSEVIAACSDLWRAVGGLQGVMAGETSTA